VFSARALKSTSTAAFHQESCKITRTSDNRPSLLVFGGPYSNLQAIQAMRARAVALGLVPDQVICTGDVVAYCANPNETVTEIRDWGCQVIAGNCEEQLAAGAEDCGCGFDDGSACDLLSRGWYAFADAVLDPAHRAWMGALPTHLSFELSGRPARVIHGGVSETSRFIFASTPEETFHREFDAAGAEIMIAGHCGLPFVQELGTRVWLNAGVIGMPANDGTPDGWYGTITADGASGAPSFGLHRLAYDASGAADALDDAGFAAPYAQALRTGLWPSLDILPKAERSATGRRRPDRVLAAPLKF